MNNTLLKRRLYMIRAYIRGVKPYKFIEEWHRKTGTKISTIKGDWSRRHRWLPTLIALDSGTVLEELIAGIQELQPELWRMLSKENLQDSVRLGVIRELKHLYSKQIELLQDAGKIERAPTKIEATGEPFILKMWRPEDAEESPEEDLEEEDVDE